MLIKRVAGQIWTLEVVVLLLASQGNRKGDTRTLSRGKDGRHENTPPKPGRQEEKTCLFDSHILP